MPAPAVVLGEGEGHGCDVCGARYPSRNKLFQHARAAHAPVQAASS